ncbi:MAG: DUF4157 domain-containing protein [Candidatus Promineifilaceae bacterium]
MSNELTYDEQGKVKAAKKRERQQELSQDKSLPPESGKLDAAAVTRMQQTIGNAAVQRYLVQRSGGGPFDVEEETSAAINQARGGGQTLDSKVAAKAGETMDHDFGDVKVHTDDQANDLNHQLGAKAFTTGKDIFFREGAYQPGSSDGQRLIAHELTHVVQQGGSPPDMQSKMEVNDPGDHYESEADSVADQVMAPAPTAIQAQELEEEELLQG